MATSKKPRKRKPPRQSAFTYNPRYLVSTPRGSGHADDDVDETWFLNVDHAIEHCLTFGPQFFLDTAESPPATLIIDTVRTDGSGVNLRMVKLFACGTSSMGYTVWRCSCEGCDHTKRICFSCKSRSCSSCGKKATEQWVQQQLQVLPVYPLATHDLHHALPVLGTCRRKPLVVVGI